MRNTLLEIRKNILELEDEDQEEYSVWALFFIVRKEGASRLTMDFIEKMNAIPIGEWEVLERPYIENFTRQIYTYIMFYYDADDVEKISDVIWGSAMQLVVKHEEFAVELFSPKSFVGRDKDAFIRLMESGLDADCDGAI